MLWDGTYGFSSLSEKTRKSNHLQMSLQRQHFLLSYLKTLSVGPAGIWTATSRPADRRSANWANQKRKNLCVKLWKWNEGETNTSVEGAPYCLKKKLCGKTLVEQDQFTLNQKKIKGLWYNQVKKHNVTSHLLRWACVVSQKQITDLKGPSLLRKLDKIRKWKKKKTISVTVTYLLNGKASRCKLSSMAELTRVQADCQRCMKSLFYTRLLCGETGRFTRQARNRRSNARRYFGAVHLFLVYFVLFSPVSFFSKTKSCPNNFIYVFPLRWWISNYYCPRRDFAKKAKSRGGSSNSRVY